jgi:pimeloyl-ACP methyl ester carboxylesterase
MSGVASAAGARIERVEIGGARVRVLRAGPESAEGVLFVHGNPGSVDDWTALAGAVGQVTAAVAIDLPDFGETASPAGFTHDVPGYADFVEQARRTLGLERVHLVGHDFGGPIALAWAAGHVDDLASVTLIDTGILPGYRWHRLARVWRTPVAGELFQVLSTRWGFRRAVSGAEPRGLPREFVDTMYDHYDRRTKRAVLKLYRATPDPGAFGEEIAAAFARRDIPALVIWGEHDSYLPSSYAGRQREAFPSAEVHVLPASGHWPHADAPETIERLLVSFLERVAAR